MTNDLVILHKISVQMSSKITQSFRRTVFPTYFVTHQIQCLQSPRPGLFYLPLSRTHKSWKYLDQENESLRKQLEELGKEKKLVEVQLSRAIKSCKDLENELLRNKLEAEVQQPERKRKATEVEITRANSRRWTVNSTIQNDMRKYVYFVDQEKTNIPLLDMILRGEFVALYGARASGKSTRVVQVMEKLKSQGIVCIYVTFEYFNMDTINTFWSTMGVALQISAPKYFSRDDVKSANDFMLKFQKEQWNNDRVVLFFDEFSALLEAHDDIKSSFLGTIRAIKNSKQNYALLSSVAIGPFSILHLSSDRISTSLFNVKDPFQNPNFTLEQVQTIYKEFEDDYKFTIDPEVIEDIYNQTNGHAALVCLCGKSIYSNLILKLNENRRLSFSTWSNFVINFMQDTILDYNTFRKMITTLTKKEEARPAVKLLRSIFLGSPNFVPIHDSEEKKLAEFLTAEGVLIRNEMKKNNFRMSSVFVNDLIRKQVIPVLYKSAPTCVVPLKKDDSLDTLKILQMAIQFFDKDIISNAFIRSFKIAKDLYVDGEKNKRVPQEKIYDTELNRILVNWLVKNNGLEVTGQWHLVESHANKPDSHAYSNIVITMEYQRIVFELLATASKKDINEHAERVLKYAKRLSADDIWIVHFTCEDRYATHEKLHWPSDDRINVLHCFHNRILENIIVNVRYIDSSGTIKYITDQIIPLLN
ncbi:hypothetical protein C1645_802961 [Glomus cerebriforme]|uniref:P-loop containing nucleoside triphosphate hydrolase protein n=1 Tax=Glomus cerebriforme TaxID=658196 RepID=A0A397TGC5_9GLOM|nr:hypothetical protein C1645_802961 [Glomus cerebriforme]